MIIRCLLHLKIEQFKESIKKPQHFWEKQLVLDHMKRILIFINKISIYNTVGLLTFL